jgi:uncharacterized membrane protein
MSLNWKVGILVFLLASMFVTTPFFGRVETRQFSDYATCRKLAMMTKGYAVWEHQQTIQKMFMSRIRFSDGFNTLDCHAIGFGPFWMVRKSQQTLVNCDPDAGNGQIMLCSREHFGVSP